jgi:hypothetical protein
MGAGKRGTAIVVAVALTLPLALPAAASTTRNGVTTTTERSVVEKTEPPEVVRPEVVRPETEVRARPAIDRPDRPDFDRRHIRHLIWRLIKAGEWRLLFHLLIRLGII